MSDMITMVATDEVVLFAQLEPIQKRIGWGVIKTGLYAFSAKDGSTRWTRVVGNWGHFCVPDVFVIGNQVWVHDYKSVAMIGLDPMTGEEQARVSTEKWFKQGHHHRCYRNKATERFILTGYRGVEYLDIDARTHTPHHWTRGGCRYGILPCNGLYYSTPHPCECYIKAKLNGLYALAPQQGAEAKDEHPLVRGPAFGRAGSEEAGEKDWPTYRRDAARSGSAAAGIPVELKPAWSASLGGRISPPVVANGRLYVSAIDAHTLHVLDAKDGKPLWRRVVGGRVDSPPTIHAGLVLFGCADGWIYALRATDGEMVWRLRAAPAERRIVSFDRLESAWPAHGSVLVEKGVAHVSAGRSSYLDGGIRVCTIDPKAGKLLSDRRIYSPDPETGKQPLQKGSQEIPGALSDVLVGGGEGVYMRHLRVDGGTDGTPPIRSTAGFLNDDWFNRTGWFRGKIKGELLVFDEKAAYGVRAFSGTNRSQFFFPGNGYELFSGDPKGGAGNPKGKKKKKPADRWSVKIPVRVRGLVLAGDRLFAAGPPDEMVQDDPWAAFDGRRGGVLWAVAAADGKKLGECALASPPVFDGLIAADGCLYLSAVDGKVVCLK
jgi:outer membrane protein assembly factor BamB